MYSLFVSYWSPTHYASCRCSLPYRQWGADAPLSQFQPYASAVLFAILPNLPPRPHSQQEADATIPYPSIQGQPPPPHVIHWSACLCKTFMTRKQMNLC
jgi:hypothetical protein